MGITWITGVLVIEVEALFALAFIFTIFVAFQGLFIFVIFVLLSEQVRENYAKWWKAKVAESDFLSKHFGDKTLGSSLVRDVAMCTLKSVKSCKSLLKTRSIGSYSYKFAVHVVQHVANQVASFQTLLGFSINLLFS